jgi:hypothetical protein
LNLVSCQLLLTASHPCSRSGSWQLPAEPVTRAKDCPL